LQVIVDAGTKFALKIAANPLQITTWLLLTASNGSCSLPSPIFYDVPFHIETIHTLQTTNITLYHK